MSAPENNKIVTRSKTRQGSEKITEQPLRSSKNRDSTGSASQMSSKEKKEVRMGETCQVPLTDIESCFIGNKASKDYCDDLDVMVWNGGQGLHDDDVVEYLIYAAKKHKIPVDKALYVLHTCNNNIAVAKDELYGYVNLEDEWTSDDDRVFWYGYQAFGKSFPKIKQLLPHKRMGSIVCHYYATKKQQHYKSLLNDDMGRQGAFDLSDEDDDNVEASQPSHALYICKNCGHSVKKTYHVNMLEVCKACKLYYKIANEHRPSHRPLVYEKRMTCAPEMLEIAHQFANMGKCSSIETKEGCLSVDKPRRTVCDNLIEECHCKIDQQKAKAHILNSKNNQHDLKAMCDVDRATELLDRITSDKPSRTRHPHLWSDFEQSAAFHCLVRFKLDYEAVAEVLGSKHTDMVRNFATQNMEAIEDEIRKQSLREVEIEFDKERPQAPPVEVIDLD